jgi:type IV pilus assembly protein PilC
MAESATTIKLSGLARRLVGDGLLSEQDADAAQQAAKEAMVSVAGATGNIVFAEATLEMRGEVSSGTQLNVAMKNTELFPNMVVQMVAIGEGSGSLDSMLAKAAAFYEREVDDAVDNMTALMEPLIMVVLGVLIGTLVIAMYLPIFKLGAVI